MTDRPEPAPVILAPSVATALGRVSSLLDAEFSRLGKVVAGGRRQLDYDMLGHCVNSYAMRVSAGTSTPPKSRHKHPQFGCSKFWTPSCSGGCDQEQRAKLSEALLQSAAQSNGVQHMCMCASLE